MARPRPGTGPSAAHAGPWDGVETEVVVHESLSTPQIKVTVAFKTSSKRLRVDGRLAMLLGLDGTSECANEVFRRLWRYIRAHGLLNREESTRVDLNLPLKELLEVDTIIVAEMGEKLQKAGLIGSVPPLTLEIELNRGINVSRIVETSFVLPPRPAPDLSLPVLVVSAEERVGSVVRAIQETALKRKFFSAFSLDPVHVAQEALVSIVADARVALLDPDIAASLELASSETAWRTSAPIANLAGTSRLDECVKELVSLGDLSAELEKQARLKEELKAAMEQPAERAEGIRARLRDTSLTSRKRFSLRNVMDTTK